MNSRFAVATHIVAFLLYQQGQPASSELIASSVNTNATFIRRLLSLLARAGLTKSMMGSGGGALLARPGDQISLLDVYRAVDEGGTLLALHEHPNPACPVGRSINEVLSDEVNKAQLALERQLSATTIADLAARIAVRSA
ncbi:Rrf2 family transcriptional regulator [Mesorhizobium sp. B2-4-6]|uniref:Rrf2 family transcriptional regulator n=1 Tax=Mesorhizobium sp. B2-4-6 TaxID=2589943 RepID=UPI001129A269|nr:Rrf2 family transcriptional regulator [Mesorhizobium sp. B2-4-6]TPL43539.1 Rrf2 family transcriptional regulator [Mesorhizobium sp. B2-4-6]